MKFAILTLFCLSLVLSSLAQDENNVIKDEEMKIQFTVPEGWKVTKKDDGYLMGSSTTQGFMLLNVQKFTSLKKLKSAMEKGIEQEDGSRLMPATELTKLGSQGVSGLYQGKLDGVEMQGFLMALMPPSKGRAAVCISVAPKSVFNQSNMDQLKLLMRSLIFL